MIKEITSLGNGAVKEAVLLKTPQGRMRSGLFLIEGEKLVREAARSDIEFSCVFADNKKEEMQRLLKTFDKQGVSCYAVPSEIIEKVSDTKTPQGIVACAKIPEKVFSFKADGRYILLENIQDPGNFGNVARTAESFGFDGLISVGSCADAFSPKAVRGSMGSVLRLPIKHFDNVKEAASVLADNKITLVSAELRTEAIKPSQLPVHGVCIAIGNEGSGITKELSAAAAVAVEIPMSGSTESLSASTAAAILMWELFKGGVK